MLEEVGPESVDSNSCLPPSLPYYTCCVRAMALDSQRLGVHLSSTPVWAKGFSCTATPICFPHHPQSSGAICLRSSAYVCPSSSSSKVKAVPRGGCEGSHINSPLEGGEEPRFSVSLRVEKNAISRGRKGTFQDAVVLSPGRCTQTKCSWPHRTFASGSPNVSDVAAVALLAH